jgi:hypothetical protein
MKIIPTSTQNLVKDGDTGNFLPPDELDGLLNLFKKVSHKVLRISKVFGIEGKKLLTEQDDFEALRDFVHNYEGEESPLEKLHLEYQSLLKQSSMASALTLSYLILMSESASWRSRHGVSALI